MDAEKIYNELTEIKISQVRMEEDLKEHMRRTEILEDTIKPINTAWTVSKWVCISIGSILVAIVSVLKILESIS